MASEPSTIRRNLAHIQGSLLDLTRRNRLINHGLRGKRSVRITGATELDIYRSLIEDGKTLRLSPGQLIVPDPPTEPAKTQPEEPATDRVTGEKGADGAAKVEGLDVALTEKEFPVRLTSLLRDAKTSIQEQGCNILFLALGMIEWRSSEDSAERSLAPVLFIPVALNRKGLTSQFSLHALDEEAVSNATLQQLCREQFDAEFPSFDSDEDPAGFFDRVREAAAHLKWEFRSEIHLGLYSFATLAMFRDLDPENWPPDANLLENALIRGLAGDPDFQFADTRCELPDPAALDAIVDPIDCFQILDADSSQQAAILAAKRGLSMVIDGPPGTGKSQTITNIIAECLAQDKTVLFVAAKSAALDVVKRRLHDAGLRDFLLDLHDYESAKKPIFAEIGRVLEKALEPISGKSPSASELIQTRGELNDYRRQLHEPLGRLNRSPFEAMALAVASHDAPEADCDIPDALNWSPEQIQDARQQLQILDRQMKIVGPPESHPWHGVKLAKAGQTEKQRLRRAGPAMRAAMQTVIGATQPLASMVSQTEFGSLGRCEELVTAANALISLPGEAFPLLAKAIWLKPDLRFTRLLEAGVRRSALCKTWRAVFKDSAELEKWNDVLKRRREHGNSFARFFRPSWYLDGRRLKGFAVHDRLPPLADQLASLSAMIESEALRQELLANSALLQEWFGALWTNPDSDWARLTLAADLLQKIETAINGGLIDRPRALDAVQSADRSALSGAARTLRDATAKAHSAWKEWLEAIGCEAGGWSDFDIATADFAKLDDRLALLGQSGDLLDDWVDLDLAVSRGMNSPLASFVKWVLASPGATIDGKLAMAFDRQFNRLWVERAFDDRPALARFRGPTHEATIEQFRRLDKQWIVTTQSRLRQKLAALRPELASKAHPESKIGIVLAEVRKKARFKPLRRLFTEAGEVITAVKPCLLMSPRSVAKHLEPGRMRFDVVIFDEASQVPPADALGAVARGAQLILVGDERQLPPTSFFDRVNSDEVDTDDDEENSVQGADLESILSLGIVRLPHRMGLRWHYRSRHSSLIDFSNEKFYDGQLRIFPSPEISRDKLGLSFRYVEDAIYGRGGSRSNVKEAEAVAAAVIEHAKNNPGASLCVGTLNQPQQHLIEDTIDHVRRNCGDPRVEQFFSGQDSRGEPFFVKNLENIQGDERDVVMLSITYGKDSEGRLLNSFGLNQESGWRRLNVLVTRARQQCIVFSSIRHDDIRTGPGSPRGVIALKDYLYAAEHGKLANAPVAGAGHDSDFEAAVCRALTQRGWQVDTQVGCAGFAIDLAVVDPNLPGRYLLGIECDGATYHSSATARDRDRLRQSVLEGLGWTIHRVWSTDWFRRPDTTFASVLKCLEELRAASATSKPTPIVDPQSSDSAAQSAPVPPSNDIPETAEPRFGRHGDEVLAYCSHRSPRTLNGQELADTAPAKLISTLQKIVEVEGPIHQEELYRAFAAIFEARATRRVKAAIDAALELAQRAGSLTLGKDSFVRENGKALSGVRNRQAPCPVTDPDHIPPEEIEAAIIVVLKEQFGLKLDALPEAVSQVFGFLRTGPKMRSAVEHATMRMELSGKIKLDDEKFATLADPPKS